MNPFLPTKKRKSRGGFNLVEATLSLGILSFGLLTLAPLLTLGQKTARVAHISRDSAQIAQSLVEEAKQGTLPAGTSYLDFEGNPASSATAAYATKSTFTSISKNTTRLTLQITPMGAPDRVQTYAVVIPAP